MDYLKRMERRLNHEEPFVPGHLGKKHNVKKIAQLLKINFPETYYSGPLSGLDFALMPDEFVLKPEFAFGSLGVKLISKRGDAIFNTLNDEEIDEEELRSELTELSAKYYENADSGQFIVEELLRTPEGATPPPDVRVYSFFGELGMIQIDDHLSSEITTSSYFDGNFEPFDDVEDRYSYHESVASIQRITQLPRPDWADQALLSAKRLSLTIPTSFVRVDLYSTNKGIYLGELTFYPGTFYFRNMRLMLPKESVRLGEIWERAEKRLLAAGLSQDC